MVRSQEIPFLGPQTRARISKATQQAVVVVGEGPDSNQSAATLYERIPGLGWKAVSDPW